MGCLWQATVRFRRIFFFFVDAKRQIWLTSNYILWKILWFSQAVACVDSVVLEATCTSSGNKQKVRHFRKDCVSTLCVELKIPKSSRIIRYVLRIDPTSSLFARPSKQNSEFCNRTCVFIRSNYVLIDAKSKQATCWHTNIHTIFPRFSHAIFIKSVFSKIKDSITVNSDTTIWNLIRSSICWLAIEDI